jgi:hypothetical protein
VLELPIHQEVTASQVEYIAEKVLSRPDLFAPLDAPREAAS